MSHLPLLVSVSSYSWSNVKLKKQREDGRSCNLICHILLLWSHFWGDINSQGFGSIWLQCHMHVKESSSVMVTPAEYSSFPGFSANRTMHWFPVLLLDLTMTPKSIWLLTAVVGHRWPNSSKNVSLWGYKAPTCFICGRIVQAQWHGFGMFVLARTFHTTPQTL